MALKSDPATSSDFRLLFESAPGLYLVLLANADYTIVAASDNYLRATMTERDTIVGRGLFDVFPDNPDDPDATGVATLRASLGRAVRQRAPDTMAVQKYDIRRPESAGGGFEERFWSPQNTPVLDAAGEVVYIIHRVEDVTEFIHLKRESSDRFKLAQDLQSRGQQMEAEIYQRAQELAATNQKLRQANEEISRLYETTKAGNDVKLTEANRALQAQLLRLELLHRITRAIGDRQDLKSIFQIVIRNVEDNLPIDFGCVGLSDPAGATITIAAVGVKHRELMGTERLQIAVEPNGLASAMRGELIHEPELQLLKRPFAQRLLRAGLRALVIVPLRAESTVFGVLVAARHAPNSFTSKDCEFLRQLSEHVALATHQSQLHETLQHAYDDLRRSRETMMQQERLRALGQMASGIAHDINNALSPASLYTQSLLEREPNLSEHVRSQLSTVMRALDDVAATVARMRDFYRPRANEMMLRPVHINQLVQQVIALTQVRWRDEPQQRGVVIQMNADLAQGLPEIMAAESEIRDALTNLVFNAVDAMPKGGLLTLHTGFVPNGVDPREHRVRVEVRDTGIGMSDEIRRRCLEPFFTTKGERGTGLGLAMVYGAVERHSAELDIESEPDRGTLFRLTFPTAARLIPQITREFGAAKPSRSLRILVVDDDPLVIDSLRATLEGDGHFVLTAGGGQAGIEAFAASEMRGEPIDAVLTDLGMPYVDGRQVASAVRAAAPDVAIILLTGWGQRLIAENEVPADVDRVLAKPPKLMELRSTLAELTAAA